MRVGGRGNRGARVQWALAAAYSLLAAVPVVAGAGPAAAGPKTAPAVAPVTPVGFRLAGVDPSPAHPLRVWILGDSVMNDGSPAIGAALGATGEASVVADSSFGGWGLTRQLSWVQQSQQIITTFHPQVIIGTWSWDNTLAGDDPKGYAALLRQAMSVWLAPGDGVDLVVFLQFPQIGPPTFIQQANERQRWWAEQALGQDSWDRIAQGLVTDFPGHAVYLSTQQVFAPGGRFLTWAITTGSTWTRVRQVDNIHLCPYGAVEMGQLVVGDLEPILDLPPPAPGWQLGTWTQDPRFNIGLFGPGACPADRPLPGGYDGLLVPTLVTGGWAK